MHLGLIFTMRRTFATAHYNVIFMADREEMVVESLTHISSSLDDNDTVHIYELEND